MYQIKWPQLKLLLNIMQHSLKQINCQIYLTSDVLQKIELNNFNIVIINVLDHFQFHKLLL